jgi:hypothetical protein
VYDDRLDSSLCRVDVPLALAVVIHVPNVDAKRVPLRQGLLQQAVDVLHEDFDTVFKTDIGSVDNSRLHLTCTTSSLRIALATRRDTRTC